MEEFAAELRLDDRWRVSGRHYEKTALAWLANLDAHRDEVLSIFDATYGADSPRWLRRWRMFFLACAELFGYNEGEEWFVSHTLWSRREGEAH